MNIKPILSYLLFVSFLLSSAVAIGQNEKKCLEISRKSIDYLKNAKADSVYIHFDDNMRSRLSTVELNGIWSQLESSIGKFVSPGEAKGSVYEEYYLVETQLRFEKQALRYRLTFDKNDQISGMFFVPYKKRRLAEKPVLVSNDKFEEKEIEVKTADITLPATITIPKGVKNFPIVIFVHGSGPNDRDETIGPNKPFRDLAHGLASKGIASIRYDKRSLVNPQSLKEIGDRDFYDALVVDDALSAIKLARSVENVNTNAIYVLGHSMGGMLAPQIAERDKRVAGIIMMAANARHLEDLVYEQYKYLYNRDGLSTQEKINLKALHKKIRHVKHLNHYIKTGEKVSLPLTDDIRFWQASNAYNQVNTAQHIEAPILIMQGLRDYQVTPREYKIWQHRLHHKKNVTYKSYDKLNHLFLEGKGNSYPDEYKVKGNIPEYVVSDIAVWIKSQK